MPLAAREKVERAAEVWSNPSVQLQMLLTVGLGVSSAATTALAPVSVVV